MSQDGWIEGSCGCRKVRYRARLDLAEGTMRCNCTHCHKTGWWSATTGPNEVEVLAGADVVEVGEANPYFQGSRCGACGMLLFGTVAAPEAGGPCRRVNVRTLDGVDLHGVPVLWLDGMHDTWAPLGTVPHRDPLRRS